MTIKRLATVFAATILLTAWSAATYAGTAEVRVETSPPVATGTLRFEGVPAGEVRLSAAGRGSLATEALAGTHVSTLARIDPVLEAAGYRLAEVECDDAASQRPSHGDAGRGTATFEIEAGETVACTFRLAIASACLCPREGAWRVENHPGSMACTGAMSMTMPLAPSRSRGTLTVHDGCTRIVAAGLSDEEADLDMALQPDCSWLGTVGGTQDGIPMTITFRWMVEDERRITGDLESTVSQQGMTCRMSRTYQLDFAE